MKSFCTLAALLGLASASLIVDRVFDAAQLAESVPLAVTFNLYNTGDQ